LVGTWDSAEGAAEILYVFKADGTYKHAGVLLQERPGGLFTFKIGARGTVTVRGRSLILHPRSGTESLHDPTTRAVTTGGPSATRRSAIGGR
jgi:hypothetical protein